MKEYKTLIIQKVQFSYPQVQAIYLFGSYGTEYQQKESDLDVALLLSHEQAKERPSLAMGELRFELEAQLNIDVDLINLRQVSTVLQKEIILADRRIYCADLYETDEFEMLTFSYYQKLNEERRGIIDAARKSGSLLQL